MTTAIWELPQFRRPTPTVLTGASATVASQDAAFPHLGGGICRRCQSRDVPVVRLPVCPGLVATYGTGVWLCYPCAVRLPGCVIAIEGVPVWHVRPTWDEEPW